MERLVTQALLRLALLRDVEQVPLERNRHAGRPEDRPGLVVDPHDAPVAGDQPVLEGEAFALVRPVVCVEDGLAILRVQDPDEELAVTVPLGERVPEHRLDLRAGVDVRALVVDRVDIDDERQLLDERPETLLRDPEALLARPQDRIGGRVGVDLRRARRGGEADAAIGLLSQHLVRIVAGEGDRPPLVRGTPSGRLPRFDDLRRRRRRDRDRNVVGEERHRLRRRSAGGSDERGGRDLHPPDPPVASDPDVIGRAREVHAGRTLQRGHLLPVGGHRARRTLNVEDRAVVDGRPAGDALVAEPLRRDDPVLEWRKAL